MFGHVVDVGAGERRGLPVLFLFFMIIIIIIIVMMISIITIIVTIMYCYYTIQPPSVGLGSFPRPCIAWWKRNFSTSLAVCQSALVRRCVSKKKTQTVAGKSQKMWLKLRKIGTC